MVTDPQTSKQTHRQDRLQYTAPLSLARSVIIMKKRSETQTPGADYAGGVRPPSLPNVKRIALFVQKLLGGSKISKLGHVTRPRPFMCRFIFPMQAGSVLRLCTKFKADGSTRSKVIKGVPKLGK